MTETNALPAIQAEAVDKVFGNDADRVVALNRVTVDIRENEFFTLLGPSGCVDGTDGVMVDQATVTAADIMASNGVIHVIDSVLLP